VMSSTRGSLVGSLAGRYPSLLPRLIDCRKLTETTFGRIGAPDTDGGKLPFVDARRARWKNRAGSLWFVFLGPIVAGMVAALSPFEIEVYSPWPSRVGYLMVLAVVWLAPLTLIWRREAD
jgi:hypothetical protein